MLGKSRVHRLIIVDTRKFDIYKRAGNGNVFDRRCDPRAIKILAADLEVMRADKSDSIGVRGNGRGGFVDKTLAGAEEVVTSQKFEDEGVGRIFINFCGRRELLDAPIVHD